MSLATESTNLSELFRGKRQFESNRKWRILSRLILAPSKRYRLKGMFNHSFTLYLGGYLTVLWSCALAYFGVRCQIAESLLQCLRYRMYNIRVFVSWFHIPSKRGKQRHLSQFVWIRWGVWSCKQVSINKNNLVTKLWYFHQKKFWKIS